MFYSRFLTVPDFLKALKSVKCNILSSAAFNVTVEDGH